MIYLDNAATTWPKPPCVLSATARALQYFGANPGRGGHTMAMETAQQVFACRESLADLFGLDDPTHVIFTANCTMALNIVIKGLLSRGGHAVISDLEHNAVIRPLEALKTQGVTYSMARVYEGDTAKTVESFRKAIRGDTRLILCMHASNVCGTILPIRAIGNLAQQYGIPFAVDAAQTAGILPIHMEEDCIDFLCMPGHKGLYGPMGTGVLLCRNTPLPNTFMEGGTGSVSLSAQQPTDLPDRFESGTLNVAGICGLHAGVAWVKQLGVDRIRQHETRLLTQLYDRLLPNKAVTVHSARPNGADTVPILSLNLSGRSSEETAAHLSQAGIAVRAGWHCAPTAHRHLGTVSHGTVRLAPSWFNNSKQMEKTYEILMKISRKP